MCSGRGTLIMGTEIPNAAGLPVFAGPALTEVRKIRTWKNPWRKELHALFLPLSLPRTPALRRSLKPDWLFSTDLPSFASPDACKAFLRSAESLGWEAGEGAGPGPDASVRGWLELRRSVSSFPPGFFPVEAGGEYACLCALLARHPGSTDASSETILLLKAREEGAAAWENACRELHRELARRLRLHEPLPALSFSEEKTEKTAEQEESPC